MGNGNQTSLVPPADHKTLIFAFELTLGLDRGIRHLTQGRFNHFVPFSGPTTLAFARTLVISRA